MATQEKIGNNEGNNIAKVPGKGNSVKLESRNYADAISEKNIDFLINNVNDAENNSIPRDLAFEMLQKPGGAKIALRNFSKLQDVKPQELAEAIADSGTNVLLNNETEYWKNIVEISRISKDAEDKAKSIKSLNKDGIAYLRNLKNDEGYKKLLLKEDEFKQKAFKQENFINGLDKNNLLTKLLEKPNYFLPENIAFFVKNEGGNRIVREFEDVLLLIIQKKNHDAPHVNALLSMAADGSLSNDTFEELKRSGYESSISSYVKKFDASVVI